MHALVELYGSETGNSLRAAIALAEADIAFTRKCMELRAGAHRKPEFLVLNPAGKVPTLEDYSHSPPCHQSVERDALSIHAAALIRGRG